jgi:hypothetical protein
MEETDLKNANNWTHGFSAQSTKQDADSEEQIQEEQLYRYTALIPRELQLSLPTPKANTPQTFQL